MTSDLESRVAAIEGRMAVRDLATAFADAVNTYDSAAFGKLFASEGSWIIAPPMDVNATGPAAVLDLYHSLMENWQFFHQMAFPGEAMLLSPSRASARVFIHEVGLDKTGKSFRTWGYYDDAYVLEDWRWTFAERRFRFLYIDTPVMTPDYVVDSVKVG